MKIIIGAFAVALSLFSCHKEEQSPQPSIELLKDVSSFPIGAAIDYNLLKTNTNYFSTLNREHTSITAENAMKLPTLHPASDRFNFTEADYIVDFALSQSKRVHGHTLVWHSFQDVGWVKDFPGDSAAWEQMLKGHINTVVSHFKGKVGSWDVVNEAFRDDDGTLRKEDRDPGSGDDGSIFARKLDKDYIARAFQYAHAADPDATLFYNDYGQEWGGKKLKSILDMVDDFKRRSIPIQGIGIQMHIDINGSNTGIENAIRVLAATGLKIHISELDVSVNPSNDPAFNYTDVIQ